MAPLTAAGHAAPYPMHVNLSARCHREFSSADRDRGAAYRRGGRVFLGRVVDTTLAASVRGSRRYHLAVDWSTAADGELGVACDCPRFDERGTCKHLWALLLEMDARGESRRVPGSAGLALFDMLPPPGDPGNGGDPDVNPPTRKTWLRGGRPGPHAAAAWTPPAPWRLHLAELRSALTPAPAATSRLAEPVPRELDLWFGCDLLASRGAGTLVIRTFQRQRRRDGEWGKLKPFSCDLAALRQLPEGEERALLELFRAFPHHSWGIAGPAREADKVGAAAVPGPLYRQVLPRLAATGRLVWWEGAGAPTDLDRVWSWDAGPPWRLRVAAERTAAGGLTLRGELARADEVRPLDDALAFAPGGLVAFPDCLAPLEAADTFPWIGMLRRGPLEVPAGDVDQALAELYELPALPPLAGDGDLLLNEQHHAPRPFLRLRRATERGRWERGRDLDVTIGFSYDGLEIDHADPRPVLPDPGRQRLLPRDPEAERVALSALAQLPFGKVHEWQETRLVLAERHLGEVVDRLLATDWRVEADGAPLRRAGALRFAVSSGIDWLDLSLAADFGERAATPEALLAALLRRERFVALGDGSRGVLPQEWLDRYGALARLAGAPSRDGLRFAPSQALLLDALLAEAPQVDVDAAFGRLRERLNRGAHPQPAEEPAGFVGTLRAYQREGLGWLRFLGEVGFGGCLADDMGLGKTVQVLALLAGERDGTGNGAGRRERPLPSLVVAPRSVVHNWLDEAARFAPGLRVLEYGGTSRAALRRRIPEHDLVVTTYGMVRLDATHLRSIPFGHLVLDEAQAVKNAGTQVHKACRLLQARHRLALSGTPVENHLGELWALLELLNPGLLGRLPARRADGGTELSDAELGAVGRAVRPFILRRTKEQVLSELPEKTEQTLLCTLDGAQRRFYEELRRHYQQVLSEQISKAGLGRSKILVLEALLRLRQAACHPGLIDPDRGTDRSAKLDTLVAQLLELREEGHKALVFSQFTRLLALLKPRLDREGIRWEYLDGRTRDRKAKVERFQSDPDCPVFLVSLKAGGLGLNLTAASYVFLLDPWWNPAVEAQAIDRAHRIGQSRSVFAYRLIARDTVEEKILELQQRKRRVADAILAADASVLQGLTAADLELLLS